MTIIKTTNRGRPSYQAWLYHKEKTYAVELLVGRSERSTVDHLLEWGGSSLLQWGQL